MFTDRQPVFTQKSYSGSFINGVGSFTTPAKLKTFSIIFLCTWLLVLSTCDLLRTVSSIYLSRGANPSSLEPVETKLNAIRGLGGMTNGHPPFPAFSLVTWRFPHLPPGNGLSPFNGLVTGCPPFHLFPELSRPEHYILTEITFSWLCLLCLLQVVVCLLYQQRRPLRKKNITINDTTHNMFCEERGFEFPTQVIEVREE